MKQKTKKGHLVLIYAGVILGIAAIIALIALSVGSMGTPAKVENDNSASSSSQQPTQPNTNNGEGNEESYDLSALIPIDSAGVISLMETSGTGFVLASRPTCPYCRAFAPIINKVTREQGYTIYNFNVDDALATDAEGYSQALSLLGISGVPSLLYVENGVVTGSLEDRSSEAALINFVESFLD